jgi:phosphorylcholine metabolism protein LicD
MPRSANKVVKLRPAQPSLPPDIIDLRDKEELADKVTRYSELKKIEQAGAKANKERKNLEKEFMALMGNFNKAVGPNNSFLSWKTIEKNGYTVEPTSYRQFDIAWSAT